MLTVELAEPGRTVPAKLSVLRIPLTKIGNLICIASDSTDEAAERKQNDNILAIWDIENNGWRSFRVDSIKRLIVE